MLTAKMKKAGWKRLDVAELLDSPERIAGFLSVAIEEARGDEAQLLSALNTVARAQKLNMAELARQSGITRSGLYEILGGRCNPSFTTVLRLLEALGMTVTVNPAK